MALADINWLAVLVGVVVYQVLGALWYGPLFGRLWIESMGYAGPEEIDTEGMGPAYLVTALGSVVATVTLAFLLEWTQTVDWAAGTFLGALVALGFVGTVGLQEISFEGRDSTVYLISLGYNLVALAGIGALLAAW